MKLSGRDETWTIEQVLTWTQKYFADKGQEEFWARDMSGPQR